MYKKGLEGWLKHIDFLILDFLCLYVSLWLACVTRFGISFNLFNEKIYLDMSFILALINIVVMITMNVYKNVLKRSKSEELLSVMKHVAIVMLTVILYLFSVKESSTYSRIVLYLTGMYYFVINFIVVFVWKCFLNTKIKNEGKHSLLIVTTSNLIDEVIETVTNNNYEKFKLVGAVLMDDDRVSETVNGVQVVANANNVSDYICREWIDEVLINLPPEYPYPDKLLREFSDMGVVVHTCILRNSDLADQKQIVEKIGNYVVLTTSINYATITQLFFKRALDILGGLVGCLITLLLIVIIGPMIYKESPGPIFFKQERVGKNGKRFYMYKFRSMYLDAEERKQELMSQNRVKDGLMFKLDFDPRIIGNKVLEDGTTKTGIGEFIRKTSLDEFPQFVNILKGDMSLVGTRPPTLDEWDKYELHHRARLAIKPGLTGMWQVSGRSNITDFEEIVKLDTKYITEWTFWLDVKILLKTVLVVLKRDGSM